MEEGANSLRLTRISFRPNRSASLQCELSVNGGNHLRKSEQKSRKERKNLVGGMAGFGALGLMSP